MSVEEQILICAVRYALGRRSYIVGVVAEYVGVSEATAQRYESGAIKNLKHETICKLAELFGCDPRYLMGWPEDSLTDDTTDDEKMILELFRQIPAEQQKVFLEMGRVFADSLKKG